MTVIVPLINYSPIQSFFLNKSSDTDNAVFLSAKINLKGPNSGLIRLFIMNNITDD